MQLPVKSRSLQSPICKIASPAPSDGAYATPRLYTPRWQWPAADTLAPPVLGGAPQAHPLDILGVFDPPRNAASKFCTFPKALLKAIDAATAAFGAPPFPVLLAILVACEAGLSSSRRAHPNDPPIRVGLFGPGAAAARRAAIALHPEAARHLIDIYAVRGAPDDVSDDPLPRGVWPVLCPAYLPARPAPALITMPLPTALPHSSHEIPLWRTFTAERAKCGYRRVLMSICADDAEAPHLPTDVRSRVTALPRLMDRLYAVLIVLAAPDGALGPIPRREQGAGASPADEMVESAFELAMIARAHLLAFYARVRPAHTGSVHRAAAAMLRHRPLLISPTTLTSGISMQDLRILEAAGWLDPRDEETARGLAHRFTMTNSLLKLNVPALPRKRPSKPRTVNVLCD